MSLLMRQLRLVRSSPAIGARSFTSSTRLSVGKESSLHNENRAEETERAKNEQLKKQKEGKGEWHEELASDSESIVKADRHEGGGSTKDTIEKLQREGEKMKNKK